MFRRIISSLALAGFLVSHLAAFPHTHAAVTADHGAKPHLHLGGHAHAHGHAHPHDHESLTPEDEELPVDGQISQDHDRDALYLANSGPANSLSGSGSLSQLMLVFLCIDTGMTAAVVAGPSTAGALPLPDSLPDDGPLFLDLRTLRI